MPDRPTIGATISRFRPVIVLLLWLAVMGRYFHREIRPAFSEPVSPDAIFDGAWPETAGEEWLGIFYGGRQVGFSHTFFYPGRDGGGRGIRLENRIQLELPLPGRTARVLVRTSGLLDPAGAPARLTISASSDSPPLSLEGRLEEGVFRVEFEIGSRREDISLPLPRPALPAYLLTSFLPRRELKAGETFSIPALDPLSALAGGSPQAAAIGFRVLRTSPEGTRLRADYQGIPVEIELDPEGKVIRLETDLGWSFRRQTFPEVAAFLEDRGRDGD